MENAFLNDGTPDFKYPVCNAICRYRFYPEIVGPKLKQYSYKSVTAYNSHITVPTWRPTKEMSPHEKDLNAKSTSSTYWKMGNNTTLQFLSGTTKANGKHQEKHSRFSHCGLKNQKRCSASKSLKLTDCIQWMYGCCKSQKFHTRHIFLPYLRKIEEEILTTKRHFCLPPLANHSFGTGHQFQYFAEPGLPNCTDSY